MATVIHILMDVAEQWLEIEKLPEGDTRGNLVEEAEDLSTSVLSASLLMIHNARGGCEHNVTAIRR